MLIRKRLKANIQKWLLEEGFKIEVAPNPKATYGFVATDPNGLKTIVFQPKLRNDLVIALLVLNVDEVQQSQLQGMEDKERHAFLWNIRFGLLKMGVEFGGLSFPIKMVEVSAQIYYDGFTKDTFMRRLADARRAFLFITWSFDEKFGEPKPKSDLMYR